ncbi:hypothetical protein RvY_08266 [Ramazzottius varieornatus]|uniref:Uncharacterized protein n=1 Tax=Ramazzottius varieornatus TaxID=947166 RepID=A0A1D1V7Z1_RAMVA|nr:hypothetical protein RvY_08266 [Ramazzottius varieornatus]
MVEYAQEFHNRTEHRCDDQKRSLMDDHLIYKIAAGVLAAALVFDGVRLCRHRPRFAWQYQRSLGPPARCDAGHAERSHLATPWTGCTRLMEQSSPSQV